MLDLFFIAVVVVVIIDLSGFIDSVKSGLKRWATRGRMSDPNYTLKPIDCSFCMTFWTGLVYLLVTGITLWSVVWLLLLCFFTPVIKDVLLLVRDLITRLIRSI
jgi:hypothetical protein